MTPSPSAELFLRRVDVLALLEADRAAGAAALLERCAPRQFRTSGLMDPGGSPMVVAELECPLEVLGVSTTDDRHLLATALGECLLPAGYALAAVEFFVPGSGAFTFAAVPVTL